MTELYLVVKYGSIDAFAWRAGSPLQIEWWEVVKIVRMLLNRGQDPQKLAYFLVHNKLQDFKDLGLMIWKLNNLRNHEQIDLNSLVENFKNEIKEQPKLDYAEKTSKGILDLLS